MAKNDLAQAYLVEIVERKIQGQNLLCRQGGRELSQCQGPGWKGGRVAVTSLGPAPETVQRVELL